MVVSNFDQRHIGPTAEDTEKMLEAVGVSSIEELIDQTIPASIRLDEELDMEEGLSEHEFLSHLKALASKNKIFRSFIGMGYYESNMPSVIQRNILENPSWYTPYTPYQAEISQGRLEALLNYQTMISDLTGLPLANSSLLDEGTAAAEAMLMAYGSRPRARVKAGHQVFFADENLFPQTLEVIKTRARSKGIRLIIGEADTFDFGEECFGALVQYPDRYGRVKDFTSFIERAHGAGAMVAVAADLLSLALLKTPGEMGADIAVGSTQRFGIPMGFGGPHAAYFATVEQYKRNIPGRIIGVSIDKNGRRALRMALQTREQHIKRERATSNICTAQALLASMAGMYGVYHGYEGITNIAKDVHAMAVSTAEALQGMGYEVLHTHFFDTLHLRLPSGVYMKELRNHAEKNEINFYYLNDRELLIAFDEAKGIQDIRDILLIFSALAGKQAKDDQSYDAESCKSKNLPQAMLRESLFMQQEVFKKHRSETAMMRYIKKLESRDLSLNTAMIPLGSCTMKLNAATEMLPMSWPEFGNIHPFAPADQTLGYIELIDDLGRDLCTITGFDGITFQPNSGAAGEYTGLMTIMAYHHDHGNGHRKVCLIPASAHGTNPASAVMAGMDVVVIKTTDEGEIDIEDLKAKAEKHQNELAALMLTYPSTHGVFEETIQEVIDTIHAYGGMIYMDGANMNAQVGYTHPAKIGADVCHLNLHKTFAIPHGGGGPGVGPIATAAPLSPYLPGHVINHTGGEKSITAVSSAAYGSAMILPISYGYIKMLGGKGLKKATAYAILNANYIKSRLEKHYPILFTGKNGRVAHELILDCNAFLKTAGIPVIDIAKRLMDYGFHAPTVAFPVHGTLMVEPTESEPLSEMDRFIEAMILIRQEIAEVEQGQAERGNNAVSNAPHTMDMIAAADWAMPYSREKAAFPTDESKEWKFWPFVTKIDDGYGDRHLMCTCDPIEEYM